MPNSTLPTPRAANDDTNPNSAHVGQPHPIEPGEPVTNADSTEPGRSEGERSNIEGN